jgi:DNA-binding transcriptional LysR family regulator
MGDVAHKFSLVANGQSEELEGRVTISACQFDAMYRLPEILAQLRREQPKISIDLVVTNEVSDLKRRDADIAIRNFKPTQPSLIAKKLGDESVFLYGTKEYLSSFTDAKTIEELQGIQIIGFGNNSAIIEQLASNDLPLSDDNFRLSTEFQPTQLALCKQHLGLMYLPEDIAKQEPMLIRAPKAFSPVLRFPLWLVCHQEMRMTLRVRRVFDLLAVALPKKLLLN